MRIASHGADRYVEAVVVCLYAQRPEIVQAQLCTSIAGVAIGACVMAKFRPSLLAVVVIAYADASSGPLCGLGSEVTAVAQFVSINTPLVPNASRIEEVGRTAGSNMGTSRPSRPNSFNLGRSFRCDRPKRAVHANALIPIFIRCAKIHDLSVHLTNSSRC